MSATGSPLTFRSGGTSLSGQGVTDGVLVDTRRHFRDIEVLDDGRAVRVQPGLTVAEVNARLARYGRKIGPDPASSKACTIGGVVANNSSGMACGTEFNTYATLRVSRSCSPRAPSSTPARPDADDELRHREPALYEGLDRLRDRVRGDPHSVERLRHLFSMKNTMGYGLNAFLDHTRPIDLLAHLLVGSEGTLGFVAEAVFETLPLLPHAATALLVFAGTADATGALPALLEAGARPSNCSTRAPCVVAQADPRAPQSVRALDVDGTRRCWSSSRPRPPRRSTRSRPTRSRCSTACRSRATPACTRDRRPRASLWAHPQGLYTAVAAARPSGTTALLEDVVGAGRRCPRPATG